MDQVKLPNLRRIVNVYIVCGVYLPTCGRCVLVTTVLGKKVIIQFVWSDALEP
jgi:hypothetical protein